MNRLTVALIALLALPVFASSAAAEVVPIASMAARVSTMADVQPPLPPDCWQCHTCPEFEDESLVSYYGVSTLQVDIPFGGCVLTTWCNGCNPSEEEEDADAELALTELIESEGEGLLEWMDEYRSDFAVTLVGSTLQISRECGQTITWLALDESVVLTVIELLDR
jgi:hypothetical protein